eukprot:2670697-Pleurochrysis_carterae.AAC.1
MSFQHRVGELSLFRANTVDELLALATSLNSSFCVLFFPSPCAGGGDACEEDGSRGRSGAARRETRQTQSEHAR